MKLCLDCGNTRIKWGLWHREQWLAHGAIPTTAPGQLLPVLAPHPAADAILGCNVSGPQTETALASIFPRPIHWNRSVPEQCGLRNDYQDPGRLGADRWAALLGAATLHDGACLVISAGTATTVDLLSSERHFLGGIILPGLNLMTQALAGNTAQLSAAPGHYADIPRCTADAIHSGAIHGTLGAIDRLYRQLAAGSARPPICLMTGGNAEHLMPYLNLPAQTEPLLILRGLARLDG